MANSTMGRCLESSMGLAARLHRARTCDTLSLRVHEQKEDRLADRLTVADLQEMKRQGKKIAAAVVYEYQMTRICEKAGVDLLSVGDSLGRNVLGHDHVDECTVDDMIPFARAV